MNLLDGNITKIVREIILIIFIKKSTIYLNVIWSINLFNLVFLNFKSSMINKWFIFILFAGTYKKLVSKYVFHKFLYFRLRENLK